MRRALLTAALIALAPAAALAADTAPERGAATPPAATTPAAAATAPNAAADSRAVAFARKAAESGLAEVALSRLALEKAENSRLKAFANRMVSDHGAANAELQRAANADKIGRLPDAPGDDAGAARDKLAQLQGAAFDRAYADRMVDDHEDAVALFADYVDDGGDGALKEFARKTLPTLREHLAQAKALEEMVAGR